MSEVLWIAVSAFGPSCLITYCLIHARGRFLILDHPNERSMHRMAVPRTGGVGIWVGVSLATWITTKWFGAPVELVWAGAAVTLVGVISWIDDRDGVPELVRLGVHFLAAGMVVVGGCRFDSIYLPGIEIALPVWVGISLSILFVVWMTNLYNFMDGLDGLAGGMAVIGFGAYGVVGFLDGNYAFSLTGIAIASAAAGFLCFNFPPARIFMGDVGSSSLGFMAGAMTLWGNNDGIFPLWFGMLVFSPFIFDATVTLMRRLWRREQWWVAHKTHYYQRIAESNWGHRRTVLAEYLLMASCAIFGILAVRKFSLNGQWGLLATVVGVYAGIVTVVARRTKRIAA